MGKRWKIAEPLINEQKAVVTELKEEFNCPAVIADLLVKRGLTDKGAVENFFEPSLENAHDPFLFRDMEKAVSRVLKAIRDKEKITVYGDYDVDGTTATALLYLGLKRIGAEINYYIPNRMIEGYGLSISSIEQLAREGTSLIISVDCGINALEEVELINNTGMEIIVTDHHNPKEALPNAFANINPKLEDSPYPFRELAGVGVAYKMLVAVYQRAGVKSEENYYRFLDLVALGTIADIVPLKDENRTFSRLGLKRLLEKKNMGINALINIAGLANKELTSTDIVFGIAPRINAAGRMGSAMRAVELMVCSDPARCLKLAQDIERENIRRQTEDQKTFQEACDIIENKYTDLEGTTCLIAASDNWHPGVIGIVASKLVEKYYRPTLMISFKEGIGSGSARSIPDFDLFAALSLLEDSLESFGGHRYAAGFCIMAEYLEKFEEELLTYTGENISRELLIPPLKIDEDVELYEINDNLMCWLYKFAPFGTGNSRPVWRTQGVIVTLAYNVGKNHLKLKVMKEGETMELIGFNLGDYLPLLYKNSVIDIAYTFELFKTKDRVTYQARLKDLKFKEAKDSLKTEQ